MKKTIVIILLCLFAFAGFSQRDSRIFQIPNKTTAFGRTISPNTLVHEIDSAKIYRITAAFTATDSMLTVFTAGNAETIGIGVAAYSGYLSRTGTTISPLNSGDEFDMGPGTGINEFSTDGTLAGNSDDAVSTEKAVKTYVDGKVIDLVTVTNYVTGDQTFTDAVAEGYCFDKMILVNSTSNEAILSCGTTPGAYDVFDLVTIAAGGTAEIDLSRFWKSGKDFYLHDDRGKWNSASFTVYCVSQKIHIPLP